MKTTTIEAKTTATERNSGAGYGNGKTSLILTLEGRYRHGIGFIPEGSAFNAEGRGGAMFKATGKHAYAFQLGSVLDNEGTTANEREKGLAEGTEFDVFGGETIRIDGRDYTVRIHMKKWIELDAADGVAPKPWED